MYNDGMQLTALRAQLMPEPLAVFTRAEGCQVISCRPSPESSFCQKQLLSFRQIILFTITEFFRDVNDRRARMTALKLARLKWSPIPARIFLLGAEIPIVEHLCGLDQLPQQGFRFFAIPAKVKGFGTFPVWAFGALSDK